MGERFFALLTGERFFGKRPTAPAPRKVSEAKHGDDEPAAPLPKKTPHLEEGGQSAFDETAPGKVHRKEKGTS